MIMKITGHSTRVMFDRYNSIDVEANWRASVSVYKESPNGPHVGGNDFVPSSGHVVTTGFHYIDARGGTRTPKELPAGS